jgi:hypothetical protein
MDEKQLEAVRRAKKGFASAIPADIDVVGVGIGMSGAEPVLKVNLGSKPVDETRLPKSIGGVPVIYDIVGKVRAL